MNSTNQSLIKQQQLIKAALISLMQSMQERLTVFCVNRGRRHHCCVWNAELDTTPFITASFKSKQLKIRQKKGASWKSDALLNTLICFTKYTWYMFLKAKDCRSVLTVWDFWTKNVWRLQICVLQVSCSVLRMKWVEYHSINDEASLKMERRVIFCSPYCFID